MADYGRDLAGVRLNYALSEVASNSPRGVAEAVARRLETPVLFYDPDYGYDLRQFLNASIEDTGNIEAGIEAEAMKDERVVAATARVTFHPETETMRVTIHIELDELGEFDLTLGVDQLTVAIISIE